jgi:hypothetical protein
MYKITGISAGLPMSSLHFIGIYGRDPSPIYWTYFDANDPLAAIIDSQWKHCCKYQTGNIQVKMHPAIICYILDTYGTIDEER